MRNRIISRVASVFLSIAIVLGGSTSSVASEELSLNTTGDMKFAVSLGLIDSSLRGDSTVQRIELAKILSDIIIGNSSVLAQHTTSTFSDVTADAAYYAETMKNSGIMNGMSEQLFAPYSNVTYIQLLKTIVSLLGYDIKAQTLGGFPAGYIGVASSLGLVVNAPLSFDSEITVEMVATMLRAAVNVPILKQTSYGSDSVSFREDKYENYLSMYKDIYVFEDVVTGSGNANLISDRTLANNEIMLSDVLFVYDTDDYDMSDATGLNIVVYYTNVNDKREIIYYEFSDNKTVNISAESLMGYDSDVVLYHDDSSNAEKKIKLDTDFDVIYNTVPLYSYDKSIFDSYDSSFCDGKVSFVDNNADNLYDFAVFEIYETYVADKIIDNYIYPLYREGERINLGDYQDGEGVLFRNIDGKPISIDAVESGDVLSVYRDVDGVARKIVVTIDSYSGNLTQIEKNNNKYTFYIDDIAYPSSNSLAKNPYLENIAVGMRVKLLFNKDGMVSDVVPFETKTVAYLADLKSTTDFDTKVNVKLFGIDEEFVVYTLAEKVTIIHGSQKDVIPAENVLEKCGLDIDGKIKRQPVYYCTDSENKINKLWICDYNSPPTDGFFRYDGFDFDTLSPYFRNRNFAGKLILASGVVIFNVPDISARNDESAYSIKTSSIFLNGGKYKFEAYGSDEYNRLADILVMQDDTISASSVTHDASDFLLTGISRAANSYGNDAYKLVGYMDGKEQVLFAEDNILNSLSGGLLPEPGDVLRFNYDNNMNIRKCELVFDESERIIACADTNPSSSDFLEQNRYMYGSVYYSDESVFALTYFNTETAEQYNEYYNRLYSHNYYKFKKIGNHVEAGRATVGEMLDYITCDNGASSAFVHTYYGDLQTCIIYEQ